MDAVDKAKQTQLQNIQTRTGKTLDELFALIRESGLTKHGQILQMLKRDLGLGHGDANALAGAYLKAGEQGGGPAGEASPDDALNAIYAGPKAGLRPIHEKLMAAFAALGPFEVAPKKGYVSLRRKKQFATVGPPTKTRVDVGLNMKGVPPTERLIGLPAGGMCQYRVSLTEAGQVDEELMAWVSRRMRARAEKPVGWANGRGPCNRVQPATKHRRDRQTSPPRRRSGKSATPGRRSTISTPRRRWCPRASGRPALRAWTGRGSSRSGSTRPAPPISPRGST